MAGKRGKISRGRRDRAHLLRRQPEGLLSSLRGGRRADSARRAKALPNQKQLLMQTSRAQVDRLLDPDNGSATIETLQRAARAVGRELRLQLV